MVRAWGERNGWCRGSVGMLLLALAGCGGTVVEEGTDGTGGSNGGGTADVPQACVGRYEGSFGGDIRGNLTGTLDARAKFVVTFVQAGTDQGFSGSGSVAKDGTIEVVLGPNRVTGRFNFDRCRAFGDWVAGESDGSWNAALE